MLPDSPPDGLTSHVDAVAETCRYHIDAYAAYVHGYQPAPHHRVWYRRVVPLLNGTAEKKKLLIVAPPGTAKSTVMSLVVPTWYLGNNPAGPILFLTSSDEMSHKYGSVVKLALEANDRHQLVFPDGSCRPNGERGWSNDGLYLQGVPIQQKDPSYRAIGWGQATIGARARGIVIDDPLTQEQATSKLEQQKAKDYYDQTIDTRLVPSGSWVLAIMTRWHESDLAAHLAAKPDWDVLHMPALGDYPWGRSIWPGYFSEEFFEEKKRSLGGPIFNCVFQGDPTALGGEVFRKREWFRPLPPGFNQPAADGLSQRDRLTVVQHWDTAHSAKTTADYTAAVTLGVDKQGRCYVLNVYRARLQELPDWQEDDESGLAYAIANHIVRTKPALVTLEEPAYRTALARQLVARINKILRRKGAQTSVTSVRTAKDKVTRAYLPAAIAEAGDLYVDMDAPWAEDFIAECTGFPRTEHDDQVDALSGSAQLATDHVDLVERGLHKYQLDEHKATSRAWDPYAEVETVIFEREREVREAPIATEEASDDRDRREPGHGAGGAPARSAGAALGAAPVGDGASGHRVLAGPDDPAAGR